MVFVFNLLAWVGCLTSAARSLPVTGFACTEVVGPNGRRVTLAEPYLPQPGDLVFFDDHSAFWHHLYRFPGRVKPPTHSGIVILRPDGLFATLESGPDDRNWVGMLDLPSRLAAFPGTIWIRRLKQPLGKERCEALTDFAVAQEGKGYAVGRLLLQGTPLRCRGPYSGKLFGKTYPDRKRWLCSEIVVAAGTTAGLFDPGVHKANILYPCDIVDDATFNLSGTWRPAAVWMPASPCGPGEHVPLPPPGCWYTELRRFRNR